MASDWPFFQIANRCALLRSIAKHEWLSRAFRMAQAGAEVCTVV